MTDHTHSPSDGTPSSAAGSCRTLTVILRGGVYALAPHDDETILETAFRAGLRPPLSCLAGSCATCVARVTEGSVAMRHNDVLTAQEVERGYVLTCQGCPTASAVTVIYEE